ncbi:MAG: hypothetical protein GVY30_04055 [Chloroflexi bacterium]|nr:hypothetical protein [Chloroflexota bacterium]
MRLAVWRCFLGLIGLVWMSGCARAEQTVAPPTETPGVAPTVMSAMQADAPLGRLAFTAAGDLYIISANGVGRQNLTRTPTYEGMPAWSPDGQWLALVVSEDGRENLFVVPAEATGDRAQYIRITEDMTEVRAPAWSPDGEHLAFAAHTEDAWGIFVALDPRGRQTCATCERTTLPVRRLTQNLFYNGHPHWSPDGRWILYTSDRGFRWQAVMTDRNGGQATPIPGIESLGNSAYPTWSPDGRWIALAGQQQGGSWDIYVVSADGAELVQLTSHPAADWGPAWSPDGLWLAFTSERSGNGDLYIVPVDRSEAPRRLTDTPVDESFPAWRP